jgi:hypothetical protein
MLDLHRNAASTAITVASLTTISTANPDYTTHRTSPTHVPWEIAEPAVSLPDFAQKLSAGRRPADFEFPYFYTSNWVDISVTSYNSIDVENTGPYEIDGLRVVGPAPAATVIQALNLNSLRPIDIEYNGFNDPPQITAVAVPNEGDNFAQWYIDTEMTQASIQAMPDGFPFSYRPVDIEYAGVDDNDEPLYAIIAVLNAGFAATGATDWWARFDMTQSEILFFQQTFGRILDLEIQSGRQADDPRWDAIFIPWDEDRPVYNHVASLASPTYSDPARRNNIPRDFTDEFDPAVNDFSSTCRASPPGTASPTSSTTTSSIPASGPWTRSSRPRGPSSTPRPGCSSSPAMCLMTPRRSAPCNRASAAGSTWPRSAQTPRSQASTPTASGCRATSTSRSASPPTCPS